jgi:16S rRNA (uracil1498-N3)-methyltransferase
MAARHDETWIHAPGCALDQLVTLSASESAHLVRVMRLQAGTVCTLIDGQGGIWQGTLETAHPQSSIVRVVERSGSQPAPALGLAQAILKNRGLEDVLDLCAQTPLARLQPLWTEHVQVPRSRDLDHQIERLQAKAVAAAQQSRQAWVCQILPPLAWKEWIAKCGAAREPVWICDPSGEEIRSPRTGWVAVGPEGGFSDAEIALARSEGATAVGLGPTRLRALSAGFRALTRLS